MIKKSKTSAIFLGLTLIFLIGGSLFFNLRNNKYQTEESFGASSKQEAYIKDHSDQKDIWDYFQEFQEGELVYVVPSGWQVEQHTQDWLDEETQYKVYLFSKNGHTLEVGGMTTGVAPCDSQNSTFSYAPLQNQHLGEDLVRENPEDMKQIYQEDSRITISVCSDFQNPNLVPETITPFGAITYELPYDFSETTLSEMDEIVESLSLE